MCTKLINMDSNHTKIIPVLLSHVLLFVVQHKNKFVL